MSFAMKGNFLMKKNTAVVVFSSILIAMPFAAAVAQTDSESHGESQTVPAPRTEPIPAAGGSNPTKHDGTNFNSLQQSAFEQDPKGAQQSDSSFLQEAAISDMTEAQVSQIALRRSSDPAVKDLAKRLIADHATMARNLSTLAAAKKVKLPAKLDAKRQATVDKFAKTKAADFDKAYVEQVVNGHEETIGFFNRRSGDVKDANTDATKDADIKAFVDQSLPTLKQHREAAQSLYASMTKK